MAVFYVFLLYTPVLLLVSWGLEVAFDTPGKNFAHAFDVFLRYDDVTKKSKDKTKDPVLDYNEEEE